MVLDARTIETALKEPVSPPPFDRDKAFDDEFRGHLSGAANKETVHLYLVAIKDAALRFHADHLNVTDLDVWRGTYQIISAFIDMLNVPGVPALKMGPNKRVATDIQHAMETMRLIERERR